MPETVDGRYGELVLGVRAQRPYRVVHGHHAADDARRLGRRPGLVRDRIVLYVVRVRVRPVEFHRRRRHFRHFHVDRRTGQRWYSYYETINATRPGRNSLPKRSSATSVRSRPRTTGIPFGRLPPPARRGTFGNRMKAAPTADGG